MSVCASLAHGVYFVYDYTIEEAGKTVDKEKNIVEKD
jgi:hypothetical protein